MLKYFKFFITFLLILPSYIVALPEKYIAVVITSYNNIQYYKQNLESVIKQKYNNYEVFCIEDGSTDGTGLARERYVQSHQEIKDKFHFIHNGKRQGKLKNLYSIIHTLPDEALVVQLDGDDRFAHSKVLQKINETYTNHDIWLTYGQCKSSTSDHLFAAPVERSLIEKGLLRNYHWVLSHPHTFYAWLFKSIKLSDLLTDTTPGFEGTFHPAVDDVAFMIPMMEMAVDHFHFFKKVLYIFTHDNPISHWNKNNIRNLCMIGKKEISSKPSYSKLEAPCSYQEPTLAQCSLLIIHDKTVAPEELQCYSAKVKSTCEHYGECSYASYEDHAYELLKLIEKSNDHYIAIAHYPFIPTRTIDIKTCALKLLTTHAAFFHELLPETILKNKSFKYQKLEDNFACWKLNCNKQFAELIPMQNIIIVASSFIKQIQEHSPFTTIKEFLESWQAYIPSIDNVGLFYNT